MTKACDKVLSKILVQGTSWHVHLSHFTLRMKKYDSGIGKYWIVSRTLVHRIFAKLGLSSLGREPLVSDLKGV